MNADPERFAWMAGAGLLAAIVGWGAATGAGVERRSDRVDEPPASESDELEALEAIGYLDGSRPAPAEVSVTVHRADRAWQGLNLVTSGHAAEATLLDMDGAVVHRWALPVDEVWPEWRAARAATARYWRRARLLDGGDLVAIYEGVGMVRIDRDSRLVWKAPDRAHHDLEVLEDGSLLTLTRVARRAPELGTDRPILEDFVTWVDGSDGSTRLRISVLDAVRAGGFEEVWRDRAAHGGDIFHTNAVERVGEGSGPPFLPGHLLLSMRNLSALGVLDPVAERVTWLRTGSWFKQHDPHVRPGGGLLFFDNGREASRVVALRVTAEGAAETVWEWTGGGEPLWSGCCGTVQELPGGNLLITESEAGRAVEIDPSGEVVWEFRSPHRPPGRPHIVATLFEVERLPASVATGWTSGG